LGKSTFILCYASHKDAVESLRLNRKRHPELFIAQLDPNVFLLRNNGLSLTLVSKLTNQYGDWLDVYAADRLHQRLLPEKVKKLVSYLAIHSRSSVSTALRKCGFSKGEIERLKMDYWLRPRSR
jgi:hypothetical protein